MKGKTKTVIGCTASVITLSMFMSMGAFASESTGIENSKWTYRAVADVLTQVNIRAEKSTNSAVVGYLSKCSSADVIERGEEWSHIVSGDVEGYIKNEYLAFGEDAKALAGVYGMPGVETDWDGVNVFAAPNGSAEILETVNEGKEFEVISDEGDWIQIQLDQTKTAYIPAEDVKETTILERAVPVVMTQSDAVYTDSGYTAEEPSDTYNEPVYESEAPQTEAPVYEDNSTETYEEPAPAETEAPAAETEPTAPVETPAPEPAPEPAPDNSGTSETETTVTTANADDISLLAALIYCEAGNQSREGKVAVGAVVLNRVASTSFPGNIRDVIYQSGQFTPAHSGGLARALANGVPGDCYEAAQAALNGEDPVPGALFFNGGSGKGVRIGDHQFY